MPENPLIKKSFIAKDYQKTYQNVLVEVVLLAIAIILLLNFIVLPKRKILSEKKVLAAQLSEQNDMIQEKTADLNRLINQMRASKNDLVVLDSALPLNSRVTTADLLLENLVANSGMTLTTISTQIDSSLIAAGDTKITQNPFGGQRKLQAINADLGITGTMDQFVSFLKSIESSARLIDVTGLEITSSKGNIVTFTLKLRTYFYGPAPAADVPAEPVQ